MARKKLGIVKTTFRLFEDDLETLKLFYPNAGYSEPVRLLIRHHCEELRAKLGSGTANLNIKVELNDER